MTTSQHQSLSLKAFLNLPPTQPESEYINGQIIQKPMPKARHSRLQTKLLQAINAVAEDAQLAYGFSELRCTFGDRSLVLDIAVFYWERIVLDASGEPVDDVQQAPDWVIEILSPQQSPNRVAGKLLHCLQYGSQMGWLVDLGDRSILVFRPQREPILYEGSTPLPQLANLPLTLSCDRLFGWLQMTPPNG